MEQNNSNATNGNHTPQHPSNNIQLKESPDSIDRLANRIDALGTSVSPTGRTNEDEENITIRFQDWGFRLDRLFEVAYRFYKRNESKAFHLTYDERNHMNALILQARYGNHDSGKIPDIGVLDFVGRRRQHEWSLLKGMSKTEAKSNFICMLDNVCPLFKAHAEAVKISSGLGNQFQIENNSRINGTCDVKQTSDLRDENDEQLRVIYSSLCRQTYNQFKNYAEKQFPDDPTQQKSLISTLQEQYYQQYISQMHPELKCSLSGSSQNSNQSISTMHSSMPSPSASESSNIENQSSCNNTSNDTTETRNDIFQSTVGSLDIQADISSEELNAPEDNIVEIVKPCKSPTLPEELISKHNSNDRSIEHEDPHIEQPNYVESVELYKNIDPPIGPFESFPEPKPVTKQHQSSPALWNPNLPIQKSQFHKDDKTSQDELSPRTNDRIPDQDLPSNPEDNVPEPLTHIEERVPVSQDEVKIGDSCNDTREDECLQQDAATRDSLWDYSPPPQQILPFQPFEAATICSKPGVAEFKDSLSNDNYSGAYEVKQGTLVCMKVPTYSNGKYIHFEFATDDYDIGFGLDFLYESELIEPPSLEIYEESDDDEDDEEELEVDSESWRAENNIAKWDIESGNYRLPKDLGSVQSNITAVVKRNEKLKRLANTIQIIPTYRRNSHEEVFVGRHRYPGTGFYILKFDNTYSVLRSKSLYFRICYFV